MTDDASTTPSSDAVGTPGCVLHVLGERFDPRPLLATSSLEPYRVFCKGELCIPDNPRSTRTYQNGGFSCDVSSGGGGLAVQIQDAIDFLRRYRADLARLAAEPEVESRCLDFGYCLRIDCEKVMVQCDYLPPELLSLAGELSIGIELSLYPPPNADR